MMQFQNKPKPPAVIERYAQMKSALIKETWFTHPHGAIQIAGDCVRTLDRHGYFGHSGRNVFLKWLSNPGSVNEIDSLAIDISRSSHDSFFYSMQGHTSLFIAEYESAIRDFTISALKYSHINKNPEVAFKFTFLAKCLAKAHGADSAAIRELELNKQFALYANFVPHRSMDDLLLPISQIFKVPVKWILQTDKRNYMLSIADAILQLRPYETYSYKASELLSNQINKRAQRMYQEGNLVVASALCYDSIQLASDSDKLKHVDLFKKIAMKIQEKTAMAFGIDPKAWDSILKKLDIARKHVLLGSQNPKNN